VPAIYVPWASGSEDAVLDDNDDNDDFDPTDDERTGA
jgi:hypothetical protein